MNIKCNYYYLIFCNFRRKKKWKNEYSFLGNYGKYLLCSECLEY